MSHVGHTNGFHDWVTLKKKKKNWTGSLICILFLKDKIDTVNNISEL